MPCPVTVYSLYNDLGWTRRGIREQSIEKKSNTLWMTSEFQIINMELHTDRVDYVISYFATLDDPLMIVVVDLDFEHEKTLGEQQPQKRYIHRHVHTRSDRAIRYIATPPRPRGVSRRTERICRGANAK